MGLLPCGDGSPFFFFFEIKCSEPRSTPVCPWWAPGRTEGHTALGPVRLWRGLGWVRLLRSLAQSWADPRFLGQVLGAGRAAVPRFRFGLLSEGRGLGRRGPEAGVVPWTGSAREEGEGGGLREGAPRGAVPRLPIAPPPQCPVWLPEPCSLLAKGLTKGRAGLWM